MLQKPVTAVILGAGHRSLIYGDVSLSHPDVLKIVGVVDINPQKAEIAAARYGIDKSRVFYSVDELLKCGKIADIIINGTMDSQHVPTSVPLLKQGYDMLLEKPFATGASELAELFVTAKENKSCIFVCHVLRYASFYLGIRKVLESGVLGKIVSINMAEDISQHHTVVSYVRGQWNNEKTGTPLLLAKSCHDIDLMMWMMGKDTPMTVYSVGSDFSFSPDKAPKGAGTRCLVDCPLEKDCPYSAAKHYLPDDIGHAFYLWGEGNMPSREEKLKALKNDSPYGRCVWKCGHEGVDHQTVTITFESGAVGVFTLTGGAPKDERRIQIVGTKGSLFGSFENNTFTVRTTNPDGSFCEKVYDAGTEATTLHGGGDTALVLDFCDYLKKGKPSLSYAELSDSLSSHLVIFAAEKSRKSGQVVTFHM